MRKEKYLKFYLGCTVVTLSLICIFGAPARLISAPAAPSYPKVLRVASLSPGTTIYAVASGLSKVGSEKSPMTLMVVPVSNDTAFPSMLTDQASADLAVDTSQVLWQMWTGKVAPDPIPKGFPTKAPFVANKNLRILMTGPCNRIGLLVRKDSGMREIADLKGRIVGDWSANPAILSLTLANLFNGGLTLDDVKTMPMTEVVAAVKALQEKRIDAATCAVGMGAVAEADTLVGVRFLRNSMDPERVKAGQRCTPGAYTVMTKGGQPGLAEDTPLWGVPFNILVSTRMPDAVAYKLVETWWANYKDYGPIHSVLKEWTPDSFISTGVVVPYHTGAIQFFKEKGAWTPEMEKIQSRLLKE